MTIPAAGTFEYVGVVPENLGESSGRNHFGLTSQAGSSFSGEPLSDHRLVGMEPLLEIAPAGLPAEVRISRHTGIVRPRVLLSRMTMRGYRR